MKKITKVVIPVAGLGTRMLPATKVIPKEMLPVAAMPIIHFIVREAVDAGFSEIIFVSNDDKKEVESFFKINDKLELILEKQQKKTLLKEIKEISRLKVKITNVVQENAKGLGHAILCAKSQIANEPFAVMLPDMVIDSNYEKNNLALMKQNFEKSGESSLLLGKAKKSELKNYGIAKYKERNLDDTFFPIDDIIEKPEPEKAPSNLFVVGRYVFDNEIINFLSKEKNDLSGEIQLTGAISNFLKSSKILKGCLMRGNVYDCGNKLGYLIANFVFSIKDQNVKKEILKYLNNKFV